MLLMALTMVAGAPGSGRATSYTFSPVDDSYVWSVTPTTYYGNTGELVVQMNQFNSFMKFNINTIPNTEMITGGVLHLRILNEFLNSPVVNIYAISNVWAEGTITWNNQPAFGSLITSFNPVINSWIQTALPVNSLISPEFSLAFTTQADGQRTRWASFNSTQELRPYLTVETTPVPLPGGVLLLGGGLLRLYASWRRRRD
jgi:hypothetical protein